MCSGYVHCCVSTARQSLVYAVDTPQTFGKQQKKKSQNNVYRNVQNKIMHYVTFYKS
jgi:hypothetical protein